MHSYLHSVIYRWILPQTFSLLKQVAPRQAEYHNYVYEMIHSTQKNPRFSQLTQYFSTLEKVTQEVLETTQYIFPR